MPTLLRSRTRSRPEQEMVTKTRPVEVQVMRPAEEEFSYTVCENVAKTRDVDVTTYVTKSRVVKKPVTTYQTVSKVITEKVPVTICVPVAPVCAPGHP